MADVHPAAGKQASPDALTNVPRLVTAYFAGKPDVADPAQRVAFGTSGHRKPGHQNNQKPLKQRHAPTRNAQIERP